MSDEANFDYLNADFLHKSVGEFYGAVYDQAVISVADFLNRGETFADAQEYVQAVGNLALRAFASQLDGNSHISHVPVVQDRIKDCSSTSKYETIGYNRQELVSKLLDVGNPTPPTDEDKEPPVTPVIPLLSYPCSKET